MSYGSREVIKCSIIYTLYILHKDAAYDMRVSMPYQNYRHVIKVCKPILQGPYKLKHEPQNVCNMTSLRALYRFRCSMFCCLYIITS